MIAVRQKVLSMLVVEGSDGSIVEKEINCSITLGVGEMSPVQRIWGIWVPVRPVEIWGRELVWGEAMKR